MKEWVKNLQLNMGTIVVVALLSFVASIFLYNVSSSNERAVRLYQQTQEEIKKKVSTEVYEANRRTQSVIDKTQNDKIQALEDNLKDDIKEIKLGMQELRDK